MQRSPAENLLTQRSPARIVVHADLSCEAPFYTRGARGSEGAQVLHHWARGSDSRGHGDSQARRQERDTMTQRSVRTEVLIFFGLGIGLLLYFFGYVSTKEPVAQLVARVTVSLISVEAISTTLKGCLETLWSTESSLDLVFLSKLCVECGEPLSSTVEKKVMPRKQDPYLSPNLQLNRSTRLHSIYPRFNHGHRLFHEG
jgi:hypothetical protein